MDKKTIAIIGGGYGGLSAGIYAQRAGFKTKIFEHNKVPGGLASASFRRGEYKFDDGTHFFMGYRPGKSGLYHLTEPIGLGDQKLFIPMKEFATYIDEPENITITIGQDLEKLRAELLSKAPSEKEVIDDFIDGIIAFRDKNVFGLDADIPPEEMTLFSTAKFLFTIRGTLKYMGNPKYTENLTEACKKIKTRWLGDFIKTIFLPESPVFFLYLVLGVFANNQIGILKEGCDSAVNAMVETYKKLGGQIECGATVTKVLVENGVVKGIRLENGTEFKSDFVISSADLTYTLNTLLDGKYKTPELEKKLKMPTTKPFFYATYGVKKEFKNVPYYTNMTLKQPIKCGESEIKVMYIRFNNYGTSFAPKGKTVLQAMYFAEQGYWENLKEKDAKLYEKEKNRVAQEMLDRMEEHFPGIKENIEESDIATPATTIRYTMHKCGCWGGVELRDSILKNKGRHTIPGLDGFYMVGNWVYSGGITPTLFTSRNVVNLIQHRGKSSNNLLMYAIIIIIVALLLKKFL